MLKKRKNNTCILAICQVFHLLSIKICYFIALSDDYSGLLFPEYYNRCRLFNFIIY